MTNYPDALSPDQAWALNDLHEFSASATETRHALSGPAGSGKTYLIGRFLGETGRKVRLTAATNKAAAVAARMAPGAKACTIHSLLGLQPRDDHRRGRTLLERKRPPKVNKGELVVVDEASMIDSTLLEVVNEYARNLDFRVLYVGDAYQLPPIYEGVCPAFDRVRTSKLTTVHRQALDNPLIAAATAFRRVLDGSPFPPVASRATGVVCVDAPQFEQGMLAAFDSDAYRADPDYCRALAWTNARVEQLNRSIRRRLLGAIADRHPFIPGERFVVNDAVADGDDLLLPTEAHVTVADSRPARIVDDETGIAVEGHTVEVLHHADRVSVFAPTSRKAAHALLGEYARQARALQREHDDARKAGVSAATLSAMDAARRAAWAQFFNIKRRFADLRPPHASTVHKSQGSTYQHAFIDFGDIGRCTRADLIARLAYVALTRAAQSARIVGDLPARLYQEAA